MKTKCISLFLLLILKSAALAFEALDLSLVVPFEFEKTEAITASLDKLNESPSQFVGARLNLPKGGSFADVSFKRPELLQFLHLTNQSVTLDETLFRRLSSFTNLKYLIITCLQVQTIPNDIILLTNNCHLISLSLIATNGISLSENLYKVKSLQELRIRCRELRMPDGITQLGSLERLAVYGARPFRAPQDLQETRIRDFTALSCRFTDDDEPLLPTTIRVLNFAGDKLKNLPKGLESYSQLEVLYLHGNEIARIPSDWRKWPRLTYVQLNKNRLTEFVPLQLPDSMVNIDLTGNKLKPASGSPIDARILF